MGASSSVFTDDCAKRILGLGGSAGGHLAAPACERGLDDPNLRPSTATGGSLPESIV